MAKILSIRRNENLNTSARSAKKPNRTIVSERVSDHVTSHYPVGWKANTGTESGIQGIQE